MTAIEQLRQQLNALPPDLREAEAARILDDLKARMQAASERDREATETVRRIRALSRRLTLGTDLTTRALIEDGRRM